MRLGLVVGVIGVGARHSSPVWSDTFPSKCEPLWDNDVSLAVAPAADRSRGVSRVRGIGQAEPISIG
jgi:hypothetical protein